MIWASLLQLQVVIKFHVPIQVICLAVRISRIKLQLPVGFHWSPSSTSCHQEQLEDCHPAWDGFAQLVCVVSIASVFFT